METPGIVKGSEGDRCSRAPVNVFSAVVLFDAFVGQGQSDPPPPRKKRKKEEEALSPAEAQAKSTGLPTSLLFEHSDFCRMLEKAVASWGGTLKTRRRTWHWLPPESVAGRRCKADKAPVKRLELASRASHVPLELPMSCRCRERGIPKLCLNSRECSKL